MNGGDDIEVQINDQMERFDAWENQFTCNPTKALPNNARLSHGDEWIQ